ncbi:DNA-binding response regulator, NarL/FixJ family, contains REC and HTH domains [Amycolatopsis xylanica]|uniref:DNA-binding response regulator, NarL/FixJ family, contains REC and HTH domains n=1 Tax=Amycolatopsis xylanica TaxID=589385 RepID=A0A1H2S990_9PSEU|nr:response regulator transcription factor [Amycolatopsis xylanica]SDW28167.1 DNA-binding response regulator, NarL/FixJ family, contains REC and HTH domains [Amycolatopsis xylanica]
MIQSAATDTVTVVLADEQPVVRSGLRVLLSAIDEVGVAGEAGTAQQALRETLLHRPDVLVLDLRLGIGVVHEVRRRSPGTAVLVFTTIDDDEAIFGALCAGVRGYLLKGTEPDDLVQAVRSVCAGAAILAPSIAARIGELLSRRIGPPSVPGLTAREHEVLTLMAGGLRNSEIAMRLRLASKTVSNHISAIFAKLGVKDRTAAVIVAREAGLGKGQLASVR